MKLQYRLFSLFLSFLIVIVSFFQCSLFVHANDLVDSDGNSLFGDKTIYEFGTDESIFGGKTWDELTVNDKIGFSVFYGLSQAKCLVSGDFSSFLNNYTGFADFRSSIENNDGKYVAVDENGITFSEDFTASMKQALIEYAEETNGFTLMATTNINDLSASDFNSGYVYHSFRNLVHENGLVAVTGGGVSGNVCNQSLEFPFFLPFDKDSIKNSDSSGSVSLVKASNYNSPYWEKIFYYDSLSWGWLNYTVYDCKTYYNTDEGHTAYKVITSFNECEKKKYGQNADFQNVGYSYIGWDPKVNFSKEYSGYFLYSADGRKLKVFNSLNALKNYTAGQRGVYFGSGFYDTPGEIKVSFDDLEKYIDGKYDDFFKDLKDLIGKETDNEDNLTEEDLEKLVDKILDKMDETGGNTGGNPGGNTGDNTGDNSGLLDGISGIMEGMTSTISGYLDAITTYLDGILVQLGYISYKLDDLTADIAEEKTDSLLSSLFSAFTEVGDLMKTKFPFSIPWDIYNVLSFLASADLDESARAAPASYFGDDGIMAYSSDNGLVIAYEDAGIVSDDSGIMPLMTDEDVNGSHGGGGASRPDDDSHGGGASSSDDDSHGGGGASRPGVGSHYDSTGKYHRAPFYEIPFQISKSLGIEGTVIIDLEPFQILSDISRTLFTCIFLISLVNLSLRVIDALGDLFPSG